MAAFIEIEGDRFINLDLISRVELFHSGHKKVAHLYNAGVMECESKMAYQFFTNPGNAKFLMAPVADVPEEPKTDDPKPVAA